MKYNIDIQSLLDIPLSEIEFPNIPPPEYRTFEDGSIEILEQLIILDKQNNLNVDLFVRNALSKTLYEILNEYLNRSELNK